MPRLATLNGNFSAGELSPLMRGRVDFQRYQRGAQRIENAVVLLQGGLQKRNGTRYVATAGNPAQPVRLAPFIFRSVDALVLEIGHFYLRFFKNGAVVGAPYQLATPYTASDVFQLRLNQKNDVVYITHQQYAPRKLSRTSDTSWSLALMTPYPPPTNESGLTPAVTLTLGATTGTGVAITAAAPVFLAADVDRVLTSGAGRGIVKTVTSATTATMDILDDFASLILAAGSWTLQGSPVADLLPSKAGPVGGEITLTLQKEQPGGTELVTDGTFAAGLASWTDLSAPQIASGTHDGAAAADTLTDSTADFHAAGVQNTHRLANTTDGSTADVSGVTTTTLAGMLVGGTANAWNPGDAYTVHQTGSASASGGQALLRGGTAGVGWIEQALTTVAGVTYQVTFDVSEASLSARVGSASMLDDLESEHSYSPDTHQSFSFQATGATSYLQFRNNQNTTAKLGNVSAKRFAIEGWRTTDVGTWVYLHNGLVRITSVTNATQVVGQIVRILDTEEAAPAGAWTLETDAWSSTQGYPLGSVFHEQRLVFFSSPSFPQTVWGSVSDDYENFARGTTADASFTYTLAEAQGLLYWALPGEQLLIGAENGEYRMVGPADGPLVASSPPLVRRVGTYGTAPVEPLSIGVSVLFAQRQGSALRELTFQAATLTSQNRDLSNLSAHFLRNESIVQMDQVKEDIPLVCLVLSDGTLARITYDRDEQITAWHRHTLGGGGVVQSVAVIPHPTMQQDQLWLVVRRELDAGPTRFIEVEDERIWGVDAAVYYDGAATDTLTGLGHLEGESVRSAGIPATGTLWATFPAQVVTGGQITLPMACTPAYAGLPYTMPLRTLSPEVQGVPTFQGKRQRWDRVTMAVYQMGVGLQVALAGQRLQRVPLPTGAARLDDGVPFVTTDLVFPQLGWDQTGQLDIVHDEPLPCTILMIGGDLEWGES